MHCATKSFKRTGLSIFPRSTTSSGSVCAGDKTDGPRSRRFANPSAWLLITSTSARPPTSPMCTRDAPLSVRLLEALGKTGWRGMDDILRLLPGPAFEELQPLPPGVQPKRSADARGQESGPRVTLVFFLGGCTFAEIAAIRFLAQQDEGRRDYVIATTKIINGASLLGTCVDKLTSGLRSEVLGLKEPDV
eukprot:Opistho-2@69811